MRSLQEKFQKDGYLILKDLYSAEACDQLIQRAQELASNYHFEGHPTIFQTQEQSRTSDAYFLSSGDKISYFFEKDAFNENGELKNDLFHSLNKIGHALHDLDPVFSQFSRSPQLKALAESLELQNHVIIQSMMIFKHARIGGVVDVHQDASFLYTEPGSCIGFWFALEDATIENGCLWAKPGGHQTSLRSWFKRSPLGGTEMVMLDETPITIDGMIPLEVSKGTCIVLHGLLPHFSKPNTSGKSRQAFAIHTIDKTTHYPETNWLQCNHALLRGFAN
ncbi:MAG: phytanoyl-CoA dioxygenase family protein [Chitinophagia bacterium]|nr:phytanoyl-CoA dioxygenase family protein [Chitinophagia bacterium]